MSTIEIITLIITVVCLISFCVVFTILFHHYYRSNTDAVSSGKEDIDLIDNAIDEEKAKKSKPKKVAKITGKVISYVVLAGVFALFAISLVAKIKDDSMLIGDSTVLVIASGSMSERNNDVVKSNPELTNQFDTYDMIGISRYKSQDEVALYDVIAFKNKSNVTIVHRIVEIHVDASSGETSYLTQGDSNLYADNTNNSQYSGYLPYKKIIGKYDGRRVKGVGVFVVFLQSPAGIVTVCSIIYCVLMFDHFSGKYKKAIESRTNMLVKLIDYDFSKENANDISSNYHETLLYKGQIYTFKDGEYVGKEESGVECKRLDDRMVFIKKENGKINLTVLDTKNNVARVFENVSEEEIMDLNKFLNDKDQGEKED